jgi:putative phosphoribosyl transferase
MDGRIRMTDTRIQARDAVLNATVAVPAEPAAAVVFAHGSGSSRFSRRSRYVAAELQDAGFATVLLDLLTPAEEQVDEQTRQLRFDVLLLARRLVEVVDWLGEAPDTRDLPIGCFGASTGAAAALLAAAARPEQVHAVVSRGGRPDLAGDALELVRAPTLLIVGGRDPKVIDLNNDALMRLRNADTRLRIVPGATHLFEEPGALDEVASLARDWFRVKLGACALELAGAAG